MPNRLGTGTRCQLLDEIFRPVRRVGWRFHRLGNQFERLRSHTRSNWTYGILHHLLQRCVLWFLRAIKRRWYSDSQLYSWLHL